MDFTLENDQKQLTDLNNQLTTFNSSVECLKNRLAHFEGFFQKIDTIEQKLGEIYELKKTVETIKIQQNDKKLDFDSEIKNMLIRQEDQWQFLKSHQANSSEGTSVAGPDSNEDLHFENQKLLQQIEELKSKLNSNLNPNQYEIESLKKQLEESKDQITNLQEINQCLEQTIAQQTTLTNSIDLEELLISISKSQDQTILEKTLEAICDFRKKVSEKNQRQKAIEDLTTKSENICYERHNLIEAVRKAEEDLTKINLEKRLKNQEIQKVDTELTKLAQKRLEQKVVLQTLQERRQLTESFLKIAPDHKTSLSAMKKIGKEMKSIGDQLNQIRTKTTKFNERKRELQAQVKQLEHDYLEKSTSKQKLSEKILKLSAEATQIVKRKADLEKEIEKIEGELVEKKEKIENSGTKLTKFVTMLMYDVPKN